MNEGFFSREDDPAEARNKECFDAQDARQGRKLGRYSLTEMLLEIKLDADGVAGGALMDQRRIDSIFWKGDEP